MKRFKKIPLKKQGIKVSTYLKHATNKELAIFFASTFWADIEFESVVMKDNIYLDNVRSMLSKKMPEFLEYIEEIN